MAGLLLPLQWGYLYYSCSPLWPSPLTLDPNRKRVRLPICIHLAPTRRAETVDWSMSGELAIIL